MFKSLQKTSNFALFVACLVLSVYRICSVDKKEIAWDVLGYYMPLPGTFIYNEPLLKDATWIKEINDKQELTGTLYQVSTNDTGEPIYVFLFGMALFYLPFFFLGHGSAAAMGYQMDGFSTPYQYALVIGGIIYTVIGLIYFRRILRNYFSERLSAIVLIIIVFGTNYIHHLTLKNLETVNILFMLVCILVWNTILWHDNKKFKHLLSVCVSGTLIGLVKPSEIIIFIVPLLWNVYSLETLKQKICLLYANKKALLGVAIVCFLLVLPQIAYWHHRTGHFLYDSYKNPGVGLDLFSPHIFNVLFSYRKGWLLYTPIMIFSLWGFYFVYKNQRAIFYSIVIYFLVSFYIICCWTYWYYGAAYSCRPVITIYPLLAICLGYFILFIKKKSSPIKIAFVCLVVFMLFLNQFQWWQLKNYILDPYRTTKEYYWAVFFKTSTAAGDEKLLSVNRTFAGKQVLEYPEKYRSILLLTKNFEDPKEENTFIDSSGNRFFRCAKGLEFCLTNIYPYRELTKADHVWLTFKMDVRFPNSLASLPSFVATMEHKGEVYGYFPAEIKVDSSAANWRHFEFEYLTPEIRDTKDVFKCYIWNSGLGEFDVDNLNIQVLEPK